MQGIRFRHNKEYADVLSNSWPESYHACGIRIDHFAGELLDKYCNTDEQVAHLVVTHGICVQNYAVLTY